MTLNNAHSCVKFSVHCTLENILSEDIKQAKELEKKGVELAEAGNLNEAVVQFEKAITIAPNWASAYNNRAQALRLAGRNEGWLEHILGNSFNIEVVNTILQI